MFQGGVLVTSNKRHIINACALYGLEGCKRVSTPTIKISKGTSVPGEQEEVDDGRRETYRSALSILLYISHDRVDCQWAIGALARAMSCPTVGDEVAAKRCLRYLWHTRARGTWIDNRGDLEDTVCWTDSDWAADLSSRRSISAAVVTIGGSVVHTSSRRQHCVTLSSA